MKMASRDDDRASIRDAVANAALGALGSTVLSPEDTARALAEGVMTAMMVAVPAGREQSMVADFMGSIRTRMGWFFQNRTSLIAAHRNKLERQRATEHPGGIGEHA